MRQLEATTIDFAAMISLLEAGASTTGVALSARVASGLEFGSIDPRSPQLQVPKTPNPPRRPTMEAKEEDLDTCMRRWIHV